MTEEEAFRNEPPFTPELSAAKARSKSGGYATPEMLCVCKHRYDEHRIFGMNPSLLCGVMIRKGKRCRCPGFIEGGPYWKALDESREKQERRDRERSLLDKLRHQKKRKPTKPRKNPKKDPNASEGF